LLSSKHQGREEGREITEVFPYPGVTPLTWGNFSYPREAGNTSVCFLQHRFTEVVSVRFVNIKDEVSVGARNGLNNIVMVKCLCTAPSSKVEDGIQFHSSMNSCHDSRFTEGFGGEDCQVQVCISCKCFEDGGTLRGRELFDGMLEGEQEWTVMHTMVKAVSAFFPGLKGANRAAELVGALMKEHTLAITVEVVLVVEWKYCLNTECTL